MGMELELRPQYDVAAFHFFRRADVEDLQWLPRSSRSASSCAGICGRVESGMVVSVVAPGEKTQRPPLPGAVRVMPDTYRNGMVRPNSNDRVFVAAPMFVFPGNVR